MPFAPLVQGLQSKTWLTFCITTAQNLLCKLICSLFPTYLTTLSPGLVSCYYSFAWNIWSFFAFHLNIRYRWYFLLLLNIWHFTNRVPGLIKAFLTATNWAMATINSSNRFSGRTGWLSLSLLLCRRVSDFDIICDRALHDARSQVLLLSLRSYLFV